MQLSELKSIGGMEAAPDDPVLGVYVLSQFVYCPRAGVCAFENRQEHEDEPPPVNLDYLPLYDLRELNRCLEATLKTMTWQFVGCFMAAAGVYYLINRVHPDFAILGVVGLLGAGLLVYPTLYRTLDLLRRIRVFHTAKSKEPDPKSDESQQVHWCEMLKAGFISVPYDRLRHDSWKLEGRPWRVLRRGNLRIPVFFQSETDTQLHDKHLAKAAAYCFLLQTVEGQESPYALVLKEDSFEGTTVPYQPRTRKVFHDALRQARDVIRGLRANLSPPAPEHKSRCEKCPVGKPVPYEPGESDNHTNSIPLPVFNVSGDDFPVCHSHCGDRFRWMPPHELAGNEN